MKKHIPPPIFQNLLIIKGIDTHDLAFYSNVSKSLIMRACKAQSITSTAKKKIAFALLKRYDIKQLPENLFNNT